MRDLQRIQPLATVWILAAVALWVWFGTTHEVNWAYWGLSWMPALFVILLPFIIYSNQEER